MKKLITSVLCLMLVFVFTVTPVQAASLRTETRVISEETEYFEDGSYSVVTLVEEVPAVSCYTETIKKTATKKYTHYNADDEVSFTFSLKGTFEIVTGMSAYCTSTSYSYTINKSHWSFRSGSATKSSNKATGKGIFDYKMLGITTTYTETVNLTLTAYYNGNIK